MRALFFDNFHMDKLRIILRIFVSFEIMTSHKIKKKMIANEEFLQKQLHWHKFQA